MFLKNHLVGGDDVRGQLISLGGCKMEDGRTWGHSQDLMSRTFQFSSSYLEVGKLSSLKGFQVTSSHKNRTSSGSSTPRLINAASYDAEPPTSKCLKAIIYGGQSVDSGLTSDEIVVIEGEIDEDISKSNIKVTRYPAYHTHYEEFQIPEGWPDGSHLAQVGQIPNGRSGSGLSLVRKIISSNLLVSIGGHSRPDHDTDFAHPVDNINVVLVPEMRWWRLESSDTFNRSFHSQSVHSEGEILILGGMSMKQGKWAVIHPLTQLIRVRIDEEFNYTETVTNLFSDIHVPYITNFSYCAFNQKIVLSSGFTFPKYCPEEENLFKFQPPLAKRNKLPKLSSNFFIIDLEKNDIRKHPGLQDSGAYNGSVVNVSGKADQMELILTADPKILYYGKSRDPPKCDLQEEFGSCSLPISEKQKTFYQCSTPICGLSIHLMCDKSIRGRGSQPQFCPKCRNLDPVTWKPIPGSNRLRRK